MKILYFLVVPTDERFDVLADAVEAGRDALGVAAIYDNGLKVLLKAENATIPEFNRVAREHLAMLKTRFAGKRGAWYEQWSG